MRRSFVSLVIGLLLFGLLGCSMSELLSSVSHTRRVKVAGAAMEPNFHDGQIVEVEEISVEELQRGDVILFTVEDGRQYLKRLIALPGETVEIRAGKVYINGEVLAETYIKEPASRDSPLMTMLAHRYFVLGDNRDNSSDSRTFGSILGTSIYGRVKQ